MFYFQYKVVSILHHLRCDQRLSQKLLYLLDLLNKIEVSPSEESRILVELSLKGAVIFQFSHQYLESSSPLNG